MKELGSTISKNRKRAGLSQGQLAERMKDFGFAPSNASVSSWEKDVSVPNALQFLAICKILGIRDINEEFIGDERFDLSELNEEGVKKVNEYISLLMMSPEYKRNKNDTKWEVSKQLNSKKVVLKSDVFDSDASIRITSNLETSRLCTSDLGTSKSGALNLDTSKSAPYVRIVRLYDLPVSAGTGEFLDGDDYTEVSVGAEVPIQTDFGVRIKGNSMEPRYSDGQTVWVKRTESVGNGEIGIFFLDGNAYCKQLKKSVDGVTLESLNPDYAPIHVSAERYLVTFGKVLN